MSTRPSAYEVPTLREIAETILRQETGATRIVRLCRWCGSSEHGRPVAIGSAAAVSISYAAGLVAVAWSSDGPVGIDVELDGDPVDGVGTRSDWVRHEALLKASGDGLHRDPPQLPDLPWARIEVPQRYVGAVAGEAVSWRLAGPAVNGPAATA